jgi:hypothetical protein
MTVHVVSTAIGKKGQTISEPSAVCEGTASPILGEVHTREPWTASHDRSARILTGRDRSSVVPAKNAAIRTGDPIDAGFGVIVAREMSLNDVAAGAIGVVGHR